MTSCLRAVGLGRTYRAGTHSVPAVRGVDLSLDAGELVGLSGPSGSGKSTLLALLCGWERPDEGTVTVDGTDPATLAWSQLALVPQALGLLDELTVAENVTLPGRLAGTGPAPEAGPLLAELAIDHLADRLPGEVSVGERQRTAVARALLVGPTVVLADEPTAHQDPVNGDRVIRALRTVTDGGGTALLVTHDPRTRAACDRLLVMRDGTLRDGQR